MLLPPRPATLPSPIRIGIKNNAIISITEGGHNSLC